MDWENRWSEEDRKELDRRWYRLLCGASDEVVVAALKAKGEGTLRSEKIAEVIRSVATEIIAKRNEQ